MSEQFRTYETAWCPGCGNFNILESLKRALTELGKDPYEVLMVAGIGQAAKLPQYISANSFCGLHGRAIPAAVAAKMANDNLTVIVDSGDGDTYGEGGNHFIHNIRRNTNITHFIHDNQIYGLTKGQASPTSGIGLVTGAQTTGNITAPLNPVALAITLGAGFVARAFSGDMDQLVSIMKEAISYNGYAMVDIFQPCVTFNHINTFSFYKNRVYSLDENYDPSNKLAALEKAMEFGDKIPTGILYREDKESFSERNVVLNKGTALIDRPFNPSIIEELTSQLV
ncbi:2-oxoacid:ferredoxin oxidoreductase subunit beta [Clostridium beijerinckii]|uniref:2-oxoglutarate ferredoxin oxidoreductase subunit beta n=1 Tax=Clostridium beijerinckii TaxID=1520 RepID=A0AAX0BAD0_CLOBE|nr:2-oxoacid:ferredoxin oxidoreductase subunit beta [Clostridium beijerinckii]NRT92173.1 2-oxoglutarate ferredoxin oxidoreductase subunit beta [Clostridium beijerinckii]NYC71700.1 2-oxoglutarate ferredoxin oxidoreductase subunit beta [Clostridium beijerinckii]